MRLYEFINCHLDDDSTMKVLYYTLRTELVRHDYSFRGVGEIQLDRKYTLDEESINIQGLCNDSLDSVASLMSVRAIMLDSEYFDFCEDDHLLFHKANDFSWLAYYKILNEVPEDDDFDNLLEIMWHLYEDEPVDSELQAVFEKHTIEPAVLFDWDYYIGLSRTEESLDNGVIPEQYFLEDSTLSDYSVPSNVRYVGDTAFSYCHNLTVLRFPNAEINFGTCPIIECTRLEHIVVPDGCVEAFCKKLPFYREIITDEQILCQEPSELTDMTIDSLMQQLNDSLVLENEPEIVQPVIEKEVQIPNTASVTEETGCLVIENSSRFCDLLDSSGKVLFHSIGKIQEFGGRYYKFDYAYSRLWIYLLKRDSEGNYSPKSKVVDASMNTQLFAAVSPDGYIDEIDDIVIDETESSAMVHVGDKWYSKSGSLCPNFQNNHVE